MADPSVLVVGAGPTGLVLALWLTKQGVPVRIVDKAPGPGTTSRALALHARTLELYEQLGLVNRLARFGLLTRERGQIAEIATTVSPLAACAGADECIKSCWAETHSTNPARSTQSPLFCEPKHPGRKQSRPALRRRPPRTLSVDHHVARALPRIAERVGLIVTWSDELPPSRDTSRTLYSLSPISALILRISASSSALSAASVSWMATFFRSPVNLNGI
jgi:FAD binding domain